MLVLNNIKGRRQSHFLILWSGLQTHLVGICFQRWISKSWLSFYLLYHVLDEHSVRDESLWCLVVHSFSFVSGKVWHLRKRFTSWFCSYAVVKTLSFFIYGIFMAHILIFFFTGCLLKNITCCDVKGPAGFELIHECHKPIEVEVVDSNEVFWFVFELQWFLFCFTS